VGRGQILKRASGSYAIRWHDRNGQRHYETAGRNRRDAEGLLSQRLHEHHQPSWQQPSQLLVREYAAEWLNRRDPARAVIPTRRNHTKTRLAAGTHREYRRSFDLHILPTLGELRLAELTPLQIDQLIGQLEHKGLAPGTIRNAITPLRAMLGDAHRQGLIPTNPALNADLPPIQEFIGKELPAEHTTAIRQALLEHAPPHPLNPHEHDPIWVCWFDLSLATGMRQGELRALQWQHINLERRIIRVEQAYSRTELKRPKTNAGTRTIPIFNSALNALHKLQQRANQLATHHPDQLLFQTATGNPLHPSNLNRRVWQPALQAADLLDDHDKNLYRPYDLRHTCISRLVAANADIKLIQQLAGHANPTITLNRYTHLLDTRLNEAAHQLDPAV
jgi:integrase